MTVRTIASSLSVAAGMAACADGVAPAITLDSVSQSPAQIVTISYTLTNAPAVVTFSMETNGAAGWVRIDPAALRTAQGDVNRLVAVGQRTIKWKPYRDFKGVQIGENGARAVVTAWPTNNPPAYLVVDLTDGSKRYYESEDRLPYGGVLSNDIYRTSQLVMRKVIAKGVTWTMGSVAETGRTAAYEKLHVVTLDENYYLAVFPLTQRQHALIKGSAPTVRWQVDGDMRPSDVVTRVDCVGSVAAGMPDPTSDSICGKLKNRTGIDFNLPGEAHWEFAARAGCGEGYWPVGTGDVAMAIASNVDANLPGRYRGNGGWPADSLDVNNIPNSSLGADRATAIVGSYAPNRWGFYDMCGNVREWCRDWWKDDISGDGGAIVADKVSQNHFAYRGGCVGDNAQDCRPARRGMAGEGAKWSSYSQFWGVRLWAPCDAR